MTKKIIVYFFAVVFVLFAACAPLQPGFENPVVSISSFEALPSQRLIPQFKIGLHIVNPNRTPLALKGIVYTISLEGHELMTGVANDIPVIDAYAEGDIELNASVDFFSGIKFFTDLVNNHNMEKISYNFNAKLDVGSLRPFIQVTKKGELLLTTPAQTQ